LLTAVSNNPHSTKQPALSSLSALSPLQLALTAATNLRLCRPFVAHVSMSGSANRQQTVVLGD
jgi:hypothetical protein